MDADGDEKRNQTQAYSYPRAEQELAVMPEYQRHEHLLAIVRKLPTDFEPHGERSREEDWGPDCSCGCRWFHTLGGVMESDWGCCANPASPRVGLLTWEHQGCKLFEDDERFNYLQTEAGRAARRRYEKSETEITRRRLDRS